VKEDINNSSFVQFQIWDFPGQIDFFDPTFDSELIFGDCGALVFVIDAQDDYLEALTKLNQTVTKAYKVNRKIKFEVFIHKVDGVSDDFKIESQRDIHQRATDDLQDAGLDIHLSFHLTSIYDHSIFEAFSKVVQKLISQLPTLENLLNILITNSGIEKAFLFDVVSKIYIATDSAPVDMQTYELCCDMIDVVIDLSDIYGVSSEERANQEQTAFDNLSSSLIKLNNSTILYLKEVNKFLALVCILREENFTRQGEITCFSFKIVADNFYLFFTGVIDYNFLIFRESIGRVFELRSKKLESNNDDLSEDYNFQQPSSVTDSV
jgi:Ras-related GTP-binding protein C/D